MLAERVTARERKSSRSRVGTADLDEVRTCLQGYADRGVFRGYAEAPERRGRARVFFRALSHEGETGGSRPGVDSSGPVRELCYSELT